MVISFFSRWNFWRILLCICNGKIIIHIYYVKCQCSFSKWPCYLPKLSNVLLCHLALLSTIPINEFVALCITFLMNTLTLVLCFFYLFNVLIKYTCVYYACFQEMVQDYKVMKILWIFSIPTSAILVFLEFFFIHDIKSMTTFKGLRHQWSANQEAKYFVNVVFLLTVLTYVFLQIRLLDEIMSFCTVAII